MRIYISLPITGRPEGKARQEADRIKHALSRKGHIAVSPFDIYCGKNPAYEDHICSDLRAMMDCDAVYFAPGWGNSVGCSIEFSVMREYNRHRTREGRPAIKPIFGRAKDSAPWHEN